MAHLGRALARTRDLEISRTLSPREVAGLQSERLESRLWKRSPGFDPFIRGHHCGDNCLGLCRILFSHKVDRANGRTASQRFSCYEDKLTICHGFIYPCRVAVSTTVKSDLREPEFTGKRCGPPIPDILRFEEDTPISSR